MVLPTSGRCCCNNAFYPEGLKPMQMLQCNGDPATTHIECIDWMQGQLLRLCETYILVC